MHYYDHHIADYRKDTSHLSLLEHGIYRQLLDSYYLNEKPLVLDHAILMRSHCVRSAEDMRAFENVLSDFFVRTEDGYMHKRCDVVIEAYQAKSAKAGESAKARWDRVRAEKDTNALKTQCDGNANHKPITNNQEPYKEHTSRKARDDSYSMLEDLLARNVSEQIAKDWLKVRKVKKLAGTLTAMEKVLKQVELTGMALEDVLRLCCERGWGGFEAEWLKNVEARASPIKPAKFDPLAYVSRNSIKKPEKKDERDILFDSHGEPI